MREIRFRGKTDCGKWVYGYYYAEYPYQCIISDEERKKQEKHWIVWQENMDLGLTRMVRAQVDPATVGQYTGLNDENGQEIYEGDFLRYEERNVIVVFEQGSFQAQRHGGLAPLRYHLLINSHTANAVIIGNIHDNPELLKEDNHA